MSGRLFTYAEMAEATGGEWFLSVDRARGDGGRLDELGVSSVSTSTKVDCAGALFVAIKGERVDAHAFLPEAAKAGAAAVCVRKDFGRGNIPGGVDALLVEDTLVAYQALARYHRRRLAGLKVVALTGSSGKTSTKDILRDVLQAGFGKEAVYATEGNTNNHVGVPQNLLRLRENHRIAIIEMGTNHPGEIAVLTAIAEPDAGIVVSIGPAHLEFFGDTDGVAKEKGTIFAKLRPGGVAVIPADGPGCSILASLSGPFRMVTFGEVPVADVSCSYIKGGLAGSSFRLMTKSGRSAEVSWRLRGAHQARNAAAAAATAMSLGMSFDQVVDALSACEVGGMRTRVREIRGVTWVNDAYNANPASVKAGLSWLAGCYAERRRVFLVLGDMLELGEASERNHVEVLAFALRSMPSTGTCEVILCLVGPRMAKAVGQIPAAAGARLFGASADAADFLKRFLQEGDLIYLKGSHSIALEKIEAAWEADSP